MTGPAIDATQSRNRAGEGVAEYPPLRQGWWATSVFFLLYSLSFIDRQLLNLLVGPIKQTLGASDFEISLLQGFTFAIFYTVFGVGIGWLIDNRPRRPIIVAGVFLWSVAATCCGLAGRYWQLALARMGVAVGEASLAPAAYSMMSDMFPARKLSLPMSLMGAGAPLGGALALIAGSFVMGLYADGATLPLLGKLEAWQLAFVALGLPGIALAPLILTVREPARKPRQAAQGSVSTTEVLQHINREKRFYWLHFLGFGLYSMINYAMTAWLPTFLMRRHDLDLGTAGYTAGMMILVFSMPGSLLMGWLVDRWFSSGRKDAHLRWFAIAAFIQLVSVLAAVAVDSAWLAVALLIPQTLVSGFTGVAATALLISTSQRMRGQVSAIYLLVFNLLGMGLGPSIVAAFTTFLFKDDARVGSSIALTYIIFAPLCAWCLMSATAGMRRQVAIVNA